jgi:hypothetical protein
MSKSKTKLLVSGCGITYTGQPARTWATIAKLSGIDVVDVSGPAVSNQWIINRAFLELQTQDEIKHVVLQLTAVGKLDVEVDSARTQELVKPDSIRNFVVDGVWPSSASTEHASKALWSQWLSSPGLEQQDIQVKLTMLRDWCLHRNISLLVIQGYNLHWNNSDYMATLIDCIDWNIMDHYQSTNWYVPGAEIDVPVIEYQWELAINLIHRILPEHSPRLQELHQRYITLHPNH